MSKLIFSWFVTINSSVLMGLLVSSAFRTADPLEESKHPLVHIPEGLRGGAIYLALAIGLFSGVVSVCWYTTMTEPLPLLFRIMLTCPILFLMDYALWPAMRVSWSKQVNVPMSKAARIADYKDRAQLVKVLSASK